MWLAHARIKPVWDIWIGKLPRVWFGQRTRCLLAWGTSHFSARWLTWVGVWVWVRHCPNNFWLKIDQHQIPSKKAVVPECAKTFHQVSEQTQPGFIQEQVNILKICALHFTRKVSLRTVFWRTLLCQERHSCKRFSQSQNVLQCRLIKQHSKSITDTTECSLEHFCWASNTHCPAPHHNGTYSFFWKTDLSLNHWIAAAVGAWKNSPLRILSKKEIPFSFVTFNGRTISWFHLFPRFLGDFLPLF